MRKCLLIVAVIWGSVWLAAPDAAAQSELDLVEGIERKRLAQTGMKFLSVSMDPRATALGNAVTALEGSPLSLFYNPAGLGWMQHSLATSFGRVQWIGDIDYSYGSAAFRPFGGAYGLVGVTVMAVNYGEFEETIRMDNDRGYEKLGTYSPSAWSVGLGYARALTDRFSVGGHVKYASQSLGSSVLSAGGGGLSRKGYAAGTMAFDFGVLYRTGFRSLTMAMSVRNFSREITYVKENFELPLTFRIGMAMNMGDLVGLDPRLHAVLLSVDAERPRDYAEQLKVGLEYTFMNTLALRAGYGYPTDEEALNLGVGFHSGFAGIQLGIDYAYTQFGVFGAVNRLGVNLGF